MGFWNRFQKEKEAQTPAEQTSSPFESPYGPQINAHFEKLFPGRTPLVWKDARGMEIHILAPTDKEPYYVAYSVGMSAQKMQLDNLPYGRYEDLRTAELMLYLPADWPMAQLVATAADPDMDSGWPLRMLYRLACMPQKNGIWLGSGHSIPNGEPPRPMADSTGFCGAVLYLPAEGNGPKTVEPVMIGDSEQLLLYVVVPVYSEELEYKQAYGAERLEERLRSLPEHSGFIVNIQRPSTVRLDH